jgi:hypothetical protein
VEGKPGAEIPQRTREYCDTGLKVLHVGAQENAVDTRASQGGWAR